LRARSRREEARGGGREGESRHTERKGSENWRGELSWGMTPETGRGVENTE